MSGPDGTAAVEAVRAAMAAELRDPNSGNTALSVVCDAFVDLLPVDGAAVALNGPSGVWEEFYATDATAQRIQDLHDSLGEGPGFESASHGQPVLVADIAADAGRSWPVFAVEIAGMPVGAVFAFPVQAGAAWLGTMVLHRQAPGWLRPDELAVAFQLIDLAVTTLLALTDGGPGEHTTAHLPPRREQVHQATGMLVAAHQLSVGEALSRLRGYAFTTDTTAEQVAADLTSRRLPTSAIIE